MSGDFLSRWSRRKLGDEPVPEAEPDAIAQEAVAAPDAVAAADDGAITPEELAALPPVDTLDGTSDLAAFLRRGVPMALRNAALRRVWAADPAIRDFIGEARDYSWDWNVAGGVPVSGPLAPGTDVAAMVRRIVGGPPGEEPVAAVAAEAETMVTPQPAVETTKVRRSSPVAATEPAEPEPPNEIPAPEENEPAAARPGRHGGALPA